MVPAVTVLVILLWEKKATKVCLEKSLLFIKICQQSLKTAKRPYIFSVSFNIQRRMNRSQYRW